MNQSLENGLPEDTIAKHMPKADADSANDPQNDESLPDGDPHHREAPAEIHSSYSYPSMSPPYPTWYDGISIDMGVGVAVGGGIGMLAAFWIPSAIGETVLIFAGMAVGTVIGAAVGLVRYHLERTARQ